MQSMKGATMLLGSLNRQMNLPALQRIVMEFERENEIMDERQEMMDDAIDEATGLEDEEESEDVVKEVLDEIGVDLGQSVCPRLVFNIQIKITLLTTAISWGRLRQALLTRARVSLKLPRRLAAEPATMTIYKHAWTVCEDDMCFLFVLY